jgi:hypothetical protein
LELTALAQTVLIDLLVVLENAAAHATAVAAVADACAHVAREKADQAQRALSEIKVFVTLLDDDTTFRLLAPMPDAGDPALRLGVRPHLPVLKPDSVAGHPIAQGRPWARFGISP